MTIYASPGGVVTATAEFDTGLTGTLGVTLLKGDLTTQQARRTTGISEAGSSGLYATSVTAPGTMGSYIVQWDDAAGSYANEELFVNATGSTITTPTGTALCTLDDVRRVLQAAGSDVGQDDEIEGLIPAASRAVMRRVEREFAPATDATARTVTHYGGRRLIPIPYDLRAVTAIRLDPTGASPTTLTVGTDYTVGPVDQDGVLEWIDIRQLGWSSWGRICNTGLVEITGDWGYPAVPLDVVQATAVTVASWLDRSTTDYSGLAEGGGIDITPDTGSTYGIPTGAWRLLQNFQRFAVA